MAINSYSRYNANLLIEYGADVNTANDDGNTPLHVAVFSNNVDAVKTLLNNK